MNVQYKFDIYEKLLEIIGLMYFIMGIVTIYTWAGKELDLKSSFDDILRFWEPMAGVIGLLNFVNVFMIIVFLWTERKNSLARNENMNLIFYVLCIPLFIATVVFMVFELASKGSDIRNTGIFSLFMSISELLLFIGSVVLIAHNDFKSRSYTDSVKKLHKNFIIFITTVGLINYFLFHLTALQLYDFLEIASGFSDYNQFYNVTLRNSTMISESFANARKYLQPTVVMFCFISFLYLILQRFHGNSGAYYITLTNERSLTIISQTSDVRSDYPSFRLPVFSLIFGILLITISLLVLVFVDRFIHNPRYYFWGQYTFIISTLPLYSFSIFFLCLFIHEMRRWPKSTNQQNFVDRLLLWIGVSGQFIVSFALIKYWYYFQTEKTLSLMIRLEYTTMILQIIIQTVATGLALDRQWISPVCDSWYVHTCPTVGMLSVNAALLLFSIYVIELDKTVAIFDIMPKQNLFVQLFGAELVSLGTTLAILHRLHSTLIFGRIIMNTYF